jgi:hypothetical protein
MGKTFHLTLRLAILSSALLTGFAAMPAPANAQHYEEQPQYGDDQPDYYRPQPQYRQRQDYGDDQPGYGYSRGGGWQICAYEGGYCRARGGSPIRYGASPYFATRRSPPGGLPCGNQVFGDPAPGVRKACFVRR